jgi:hypothetical protein
VSDNGDDNGDEESSGPRAVPRLTISQRVLASLPNLQRTRPTQPPARAPAPAPTRRTRNTPDTSSSSSGSGSGSAGDVVTPDEVLSPGTVSDGRRTAPAAPGASAARPPRGTPSGLSKEELTHVIKRIDDRERVVVWFTAGLGVVVGVLLTVLTLHLNPPLHAKNHQSTSLITFEGAARPLLSGVVVLAAWKRRRSLVAFAILLLGTSMGGLFALPFFGVGLWLIFRVLKLQRELAAMTGQTRPRAEPRTKARAEPTPRPRATSGGRADPVARGRAGAETRRRARAERLAAARAGRGGKKKEPEPAGPPKSKRYTPPRQIRPRPPGAV